MQKKEVLPVFYVLSLFLVTMYTSAATRQLDFFFTDHCCPSSCRGFYFSGQQESQTVQEIAVK